MFRPTLLALSLLAALAVPAQAAGMITSQPQVLAEQPTAWVVAPFNNERPQPLMFLGVAKVEANEGVLDRSLRLVAGAGMLYLGVANPVAMPAAGAVTTGVVGGVLAFTGLTGFCPLYLPFGVNTR